MTYSHIKRKLEKLLVKISQMKLDNCPYLEY